MLKFWIYVFKHEASELCLVVAVFTHTEREEVIVLNTLASLPCLSNFYSSLVFFFFVFSRIRRITGKCERMMMMMNIIIIFAFCFPIDSLILLEEAGIPNSEAFFVFLTSSGASRSWNYEFWNFLNLEILRLLNSEDVYFDVF